jgi:chaperonin cofactor prefoldin
MISFFRNLAGNNVNNTPTPPSSVTTKSEAFSEQIHNLFEQRKAIEWNLKNRHDIDRQHYEVELAELMTKLKELDVTEEDYQNYLKTTVH